MRFTTGFTIRFLLLLGLTGLVLSSGGCGSSSATLAPVSGKVTINGQPLTKGTVIYKPDKAKGNTFGGEPVGEIDANGVYTLQTRGKPGAPVGWYKITVSVIDAPPDNTKVDANPQSQINPTYLHVDTTPLEKEVVAPPKVGNYDLQLQ
jgi:hypothetical protein